MFEDQLIEIPCPNCGHKTKEPLKKLLGKLNPKLACRRCGVTSDIDTAKARKAFDAIANALKKL